MDGQTTSTTFIAAQAPVHSEPAVRFLRGRDAIFRVHAQLAHLAARCDQSGDADNLAHFLTTSDALKKIPHLLLFTEHGERRRGGRDGKLERLAGAVLVFEYRIAGRRSRVFSTSDSTGRRNVFGLSEYRAQISVVAARMLVDRGAQIAQIAWSETHGGQTHGSERKDSGADMLRASAESRQPSESERSIASELSIASPQRCRGSWSLRESKVPLYLPLGLTFDATLARIGQRTRSNLRYYRRRSEADLGCSFVANVTIDLQDFLAFNRECTYAVPDALAKWRYRSLGTLINPFLRGIRDGNGRWLSLVGGRRQCGFAEIDWQMNRADLPQYSLSTVLRSYLLEHEVREGSSRLYIEGGTPHPIGRSFVSGHVNELTLKRSSPYVELMEKFSRRPFLAKNHLAQTLQDPDLRWTSW